MNNLIGESMTGERDYMSGVGGALCDGRMARAK